ncbi:MAG TPA: type II toxin-antitoxin system VapB family antitoxin [Polyangia bacterium]|jgi:Arc/MetJ family transcription regulator|nr:type II toxin-antitoxin system VapB family antitoxin [Polyangia bacterium]
MRTTMILPDELLRKAQRACGAPTKTATVEAGLKLLVEREAARRLIALRGKIPDLAEVPRRRPAAPRRKTRR